MLTRKLGQNHLQSSPTYMSISHRKQWHHINNSISAYRCRVPPVWSQTDSMLVLEYIAFFVIARGKKADRLQAVFSCSGIIKWDKSEEYCYLNTPVITIGFPAELIKVPFPRKLPVAHQVLLTGFSGLTVFVTRFNSTDHAGCPLTERGLCSLYE